MDPTFLILLLGLVVLFWFMSRQGKKAQAKQRERIAESLVPGAWVQTIARGYHQVVEVNGDVITLSNPDGTEILVHRTGIMGPTESPYELMAEHQDDEQASETSIDSLRDSVGDETPAIEQSDDWSDDKRDNDQR